MLLHSTVILLAVRGRENIGRGTYSNVTREPRQFQDADHDSDNDSDFEIEPPQLITNRRGRGGRGVPFRQEPIRGIGRGRARKSPIVNNGNT